MKTKRKYQEMGWGFWISAFYTHTHECIACATLAFFAKKTTKGNQTMVQVLTVKTVPSVKCVKIAQNNK